LEAQDGILEGGAMKKVLLSVEDNARHVIMFEVLEGKIGETETVEQERSGKSFQQLVLSRLLVS
jgi:hypothetical protein